MRDHQPNIIPLRQRIILAIFALYLAVFIVSEIVTGYTYIPGRRSGGFFLSGIPALMIAIAAALLLIAAMLTIIDHYDKRPNEVRYQKTKSTCYKFALAFVVWTPLYEFADYLLRKNGHTLLPEFHGVASHYTLYAPQLASYVPYLSPILDNQLTIGIASTLAVLPMIISENLYLGRTWEIFVLLAMAGMAGISTIFLAHSLKDFMLGAVTIGGYHTGTIIHASDQPAKFNALLLASFSVSCIMLLSSAFVFIGILTKKIKMSVLQLQNPPKPF